MSFLSLDVGTVRIGCAYAMNSTSAVLPLKVVIHKGDWLKNILDLIKEYEVEILVVGKPNSLDGKSGKSVDMVNEVVQQLVISNNELEVVFVDERYTSKIAQDRLHDFGLNVKQSRSIIDSIAACVILESYLNQKNN